MLQKSGTILRLEINKTVEITKIKQLHIMESRPLF